MKTVSKKIGILFVHGIGEQDANFADSAARELFEYTGRRISELSSGKFAFGSVDWEAASVWWSPILADRQAEFYGRCLNTGLIKDDIGHRFFCKYVTDLIAYYNSKDDGAGRKGD